MPWPTTIQVKGGSRSSRLVPIFGRLCFTHAHLFVTNYAACNQFEVTALVKLGKELSDSHWFGSSLAESLLEPDEIGNLIEEVVILARQINLEVDSDDVQELLDFHIQELTIHELIKMHEQEKDIEELESIDLVKSEDRMAIVTIFISGPGHRGSTGHLDTGGLKFMALENRMHVKSVESSNVLLLMRCVSGVNFVSRGGCGSLVVKVSDRSWHVMSSSPVSLKTLREGKRCALNPSRAKTSSRWRGVVVSRGVPAQMSSSSLDHGSN
ncbi:hypothetical protein TNCV_1321111 [Trichonephila clavipes]|nr:hypothetical protein TNCV_1321111 [Trichonephila clavipes]